MKIGRNEPCPCGSGLKYKKCHLNREEQQPVTEGDVRGLYSTHKIRNKCYHPNVGSECKGKIIKSHTVSKSSSLRKICRDGHVYNFKPDINSLFDNDGELALKLVGIAQASTFPGFCSYHDKKMFAQVEDKDFESNSVTSYLLGFRALTKEMHAKQSVITLIPKMRQADRGMQPHMQEHVQTYLDAYQQGTEYGLRDLEHHKGKYDAMFISNDYTLSNYMIIQFDSPPNMLFSGCIYPEYDFKGNELQKLGLGTKVLDSIAINAIATKSGGAIVFHWIGDSAANNQLVSSISSLPSEQLASAITQFAFESFENLFLAPDWWDKLGKLSRNLSERVLCGTPRKNHTAQCFVPDGNNYAAWENPRVNTNVKI